MSKIKEKIPILQWLPGYQRSWLKHDLFAGLTVGVVLIPQGIAYATIAGLPPIYGLYTALIPQLVYAVMGTSRQLSVGPAAMDSLIIASGVGALATLGSENFIVISILLAFLVGLFQFLFGLFRLGFLVNFLSRPVISGFTSGSAIIIGLNQLGNLAGIDLDRSNQIHVLLKSLIQSVSQVHWPSLAMGVLAIVFLLLMKRFFKRIPASLLVVLIGVALVFFLGLNSRGIDILGTIPSGLPPFQLPALTQEMIAEVSGLALTLALIGFLEAISIAKSMESKHNSYQVRPNQELIALGLGNMAGSFFQTFPATGGFSRTAVNDETGAKTPLSSFVAALVIGLTLVFLTPVFYFLPTPILAAIIVVSAYSLLDFSMPKNLLSFNVRDLVILNSTLLFTLFVGIKEGILFGIVLSLAMLIYKSTKPHMAVLGQVPGTHFYRNVKRFKDVIKDPQILVVRFDAQLYFANTNYFKDKLKKYVREKGPDLRLLIIDGESMNALDSSAIYALDEILDFFRDKGIIVAFSGLKGPVRDSLVKSGLMKKIRFDHCFMSIQEAIDSYRDTGLETPGRYSYQEYTKQVNR